MSYKSDTLTKPGDDHDGEDDEEGAEDDDSHVHVFFSLQWSEVVRKVGTGKKFCGKIKIT